MILGGVLLLRLKDGDELMLQLLLVAAGLDWLATDSDLSQQFPRAFALLDVVFLIIVWAIQVPGPMSGPMELPVPAVG